LGKEILSMRKVQSVREVWNWIRHCRQRWLFHRWTKQIGSDVAGELRPAVLRKSASMSRAELAEYLETRAGQSAHKRVDELLRSGNSLDPAVASRLIIEASRRAKGSLLQEFEASRRRPGRKVA
jgi:hypothetical protein